MSIIQPSKLKIVYSPRGRADEYARQRDYPGQIPLAVNLYTGCGHGCAYCYAPAVLRCDRAMYAQDAVPKKDALERFEKDCAYLQSAGNRAPIFASFTTDPLNPMDRVYMLTHRAVDIAHKHGQRVNLLTKCGLDDHTMDLLDRLHKGPGGDILGVTLTTFRDTEFEPFAGPPCQRFNLLNEVHEQGIETRVSFEPVLFPDETLRMIREVRSITTLIQVGKLNAQANESPAVRAIRTSINWGEFGRQAEALLKSLPGEWYIKDDLRKEMAR